MSKTPSKKPKIEEYRASVTVMGRTAQAKGKSPQEAISNLEARNLAGTGVLVVEKGKTRKERILTPHTVNKLFNSHGLHKEVVLKQVSSLFEGI